MLTSPADTLVCDTVQIAKWQSESAYDYNRELITPEINVFEPVGLISDTFNFAYISDMTIYVCRANYTTKDNIRYANTLVQNNRLKKMSFVINATNAKQGYGYGYGNKNAQ